MKKTQAEIKAELKRSHMIGRVHTLSFHPAPIGKGQIVSYIHAYVSGITGEVVEEGRFAYYDEDGDCRWDQIAE